MYLLVQELLQQKVKLSIKKVKINLEVLVGMLE